ncbi:hypothetical protein [Nocardia sp. NPDC056100]|uniref:LppU/SCO3897 family protein n=1 Tax=Nocardia sp. NPDC056100 TaxID=3345712 RepID=UPI0035DA3F1B
MSRGDGVRLAVGDCVDAAGLSVTEAACGDSLAMYRIVGREGRDQPPSSACLKYDDATTAFLVPETDREDAGTVLCVAPTRVNTTVMSGLQAGDCFIKSTTGSTVMRVTCGTRVTIDVLGVEVHQPVPIAEPVCDKLPATRAVYVESLFGGARSRVLCTRSADPNAVVQAEIGSCINEGAHALVACDAPAAVMRLLNVRSETVDPVAPECANVLGAGAVNVQKTEGTTFHLVQCFGPIPTDFIGYAAVGDCIAAPNPTVASLARITDCTDPTAEFQVSERHQGNDGKCPLGTERTITNPSDVGGDGTICLRRR